MVKPVDNFALWVWCKEHRLMLQPELRFHVKRRWRFDYGIPELMTALEVEGLSSNGKSRHTTWGGYEGDCEKYNQAAILGWTVLRYSQRQWNREAYIGDLDQVWALKAGIPERTQENAAKDHAGQSGIDR